MKRVSWVTFLVLIILLGEAQALTRPDTARVVKAHQDIRALSAALELYKQDHGTYPTTSEGLSALLQPIPDEELDCEPGGYIKRLPKDPWGNDYQYENPGKRGEEIEIWTLGADGIEGGEGHDADYGNWPGSFDTYYAESRRNDRATMLAGIVGGGALFGFLLGLPLVVAGAVRKESKMIPKLKLSIGVLIYLTLASPLILGIFIYFLSSGVIV